jgi:hypothetical protein
MAAVTFLGEQTTVISAFALGHRGDDAATYSYSLRDFSEREFAAVQFPANFHNQCSGEHRSFLIEMGGENWKNRQTAAAGRCSAGRPFDR